MELSILCRSLVRVPKIGWVKADAFPFQWWLPVEAFAHCHEVVKELLLIGMSHIISRDTVSSGWPCFCGAG